MTSSPFSQPSSHYQVKSIILLAVLWFVLRIPALLGSVPTRTLGEAGQAMGQAAEAALSISVAEVQAIASAGVALVGVGVGLLFI